MGTFKWDTLFYEASKTKKEFIYSINEFIIYGEALNIIHKDKDKRIEKYKPNNGCFFAIHGTIST